MTTLKKLSTIITVFSCLLFSLTACSQGTIASKNYITKDVPVTEFDAIKLIGSPDIIYTQSTDGKTSVQICGSDNLIDLLDVQVTEHTLVVRYKSRANIINFGKNGKLKVLASSPSIRSAVLDGSGDLILKGDIQTSDMAISLHGSGDIKSEGNIQAQTCNVQLSGSGDIRLKSISANTGKIALKGSGDVNIKSNSRIADMIVSLHGSGDIKVSGISSNAVSASLKGSGDIELKGYTKNADLQLINSGDMKASGLQAENVVAGISGSGRITCHATGKLKATVRGSGDIRYKGSPTVSVDKSGPGSIKKL